MSMESYTDFIRQAGNLKTLERAGWVRRDITKPESVADHSYRNAILALILPLDEHIDRMKLVKMMLVHDLPESDPTVGDITLHDGISHDEKLRRESEAMQKLCALIPGGQELHSLWEEYAQNTTPEAQIAHELDKIECAIQAQEYHKSQAMDPEEFIRNALRAIHTDTGRKLFDLLVQISPTKS